MSKIFDDVVLIVSGPASNGSWIGSGTLVAPNRVLTASHVIRDEQGQEKPHLGIMVRGASAPIAASLIWDGQPNLDIAVLALAGTEERKPAFPPLVALSSAEIPTSTAWEAQGYPRVRDQQSSTRLEKVRGAACSYRKVDARIDLDVGAAPDDFRGLSGASVVVCDRIVGVVRAVPTNWDGKRLEATPVGKFLDLAGFREALGVSKPDADYAVRVGRIVDCVARILEKNDYVVSVLAARLEIEYAPGNGARVLASRLVLGQQAMDMARMLNHVDAELATANAPKEARHVLRSLLWYVLPMAIDWKDIVVQGLATFSAKQNALDLPLQKETLAEIVLAGIDDRCCRFAPVASDQMPVGASVVRIPAMARSALFDRDGSRLAQLVVKQLAAEINVDVRDDRYEQMRDDVEGVLQYHAFDAPEGEQLPYYLLFVETDLRGADPTADLWTLARERLGKELPTLRLVRLRGGNAVQEMRLAKMIEAICKRP